MQPKPAVDHRLPGINARPVGTIKVRLQALTGKQLGVGDQEIQLQTPLVGVLHPQNAVLVLIESGHQNPLKAGHEFFTLPGRQVSLRERQHTGGVFLHVRRGVDELPDLFRPSLQDAGAFTLPVFPEQVIHRSGAAAATARMKFNDHHLYLSPEPRGAAARGWHR
jgi:hypothetical protein